MLARGRHTFVGDGHGDPVGWQLRGPIRPSDGPTRRALLVAAVGGVLAASATVATGLAAAPGEPPVPRTAADLGPVPTAAAVPARPVALRIPAIDVSAPLVPIDVDGAGVLQPPTTTDVVGWFVRSALPGTAGPAVLAGHIDSYAGPGVFFHLHAIPLGALVDVVAADGSEVTFRTVDVTSTAKDAFPTAAVYGPTPDAELRLITCGGQFDHRERRYLQNVVVTALPAS